MSITHERRMKLMAFADGELEGAERDEVCAWLATDGDAARFVNDLATLGDLVKLGHEGGAQAKAIAAFDVADAVMAKLADGEAREDPPAVVSLDAARARRRGSQSGLRSASLDGARRGTPPSEAGDGGPAWKVGAGIVVALALAASVLLIARSKGEQPLAGSTGSSVQPAANGTGPGVDVDLAESPGQTVSVFYLPSETTLTTSVVVWVDETGDK